MRSNGAEQDRIAGHASGIAPLVGNRIIDVAVSGLAPAGLWRCMGRPGPVFFEPSRPLVENVLITSGNLPVEHFGHAIAEPEPAEDVRRGGDHVDAGTGRRLRGMLCDVDWKPTIPGAI